MVFKAPSSSSSTNRSSSAQGWRLAAPLNFSASYAQLDLTDLAKFKNFIEMTENLRFSPMEAAHLCGIAMSEISPNQYLLDLNPAAPKSSSQVILLLNPPSRTFQLL